MNKLYVIAPLIGLALFSGVYANHVKIHEARVAQAKQRDALMKEEKLRHEGLARQQAHATALRQLAQRKKEKEEKEYQLEQQKQARSAAEQRRLAADAEEKRLRIKLERLRTDVTSVAEVIRTNEQRQSALEQERAFIATYVREAEANRASLLDLLEKFEAAVSAPATPATP
jgi:hypothetical protein